METKLDKVMDRIRKLLALSTSSNPNEAATAAAKAAKMMAEYELEEADLRVESGEANLDLIEEDTWEDESSSRVREWKGVLLVGLVKGFNCYAYQARVGQPKSKKTVLRVVGRRNNIRAANYMYLYLTKEVQGMGEKAWAALPSSQASMFHGKRWKNSFLLGAAVTIQKRLIEQADANKGAQAQSKGGELIKRDQAEVDAFWQQILARKKFRDAPSTSDVSLDAYGQGKEAGASVNLGGNAALGTAPRQIT